MAMPSAQEVAAATAVLPRPEAPAPANTTATRKRRRTRTTDLSAAALSALPPQYLAFLVEAGTALSHPLDHEHILSTTGTLAVPDLADFAVLYLADDHGEMRLEQTWHSGGAYESRLDSVWKRSLSQPAFDSPLTPGVTAELHSLFGSSAPVLMTVGAGTQTSRRINTRNLVAFMAKVGLRSAIFLTLRSSGRTAGALMLCAVEAGRYSSAELTVARAFALLVESAFARERQVVALQHSTRQRQQWFAAMAHDLASSLTVIRLHTQYLRHAIQGSPDAGAEATLPTMDPVDPVPGRLARLEATAVAATTLLDDMKDLAEGEAMERIVFQREPTDLVALTSHTVTTYQELTIRHRIRLVVSEERLIGYWDRRKLERALGNLLTNAIKYSPNGGEVVVEVRRERAGRAGVRAVLRVRDEGLGIAEAEIPHIFEPFQRGKGVADRIPGMGLGLANVRQIVEGHGGAVLVASEPGAGSTFTIKLPLAHDASLAL